VDSVLETFAADHGACDRCFADAEAAVAAGRWEEAGRTFAEFEAAFERHLRAEEDVLFPALLEGAAQAEGMTGVMRAEHADMREVVAQMAARLARCDAEGFLGQADTLLVLMQQHNLKEESVLYPLADEVLDEASRADAAAGLRARPGA
jgi:iron-sulfur cluster repair protein YtfE (RIC family)